MSQAILLNHGYTELNVIDLPVKQPREWDPSITDPTFYTPVGSLVRKLNAQDKIPMNRNPLYYDFPNYKDTGMELPISRYPSADIAEISEAVVKGSEQISKDLKKAAEKAKVQRQTDQAVSDSTSVPSQPTE